MKINKNKLRRIIKETILRESLHGNYEKIARLLMTPLEEDVKQAISLGEAMGYFELYDTETLVAGFVRTQYGDPALYNRYYINFHDSDFFKYLVANYTQIPRLDPVSPEELMFSHPYNWLKPGWDYTKGQLVLSVKQINERQGTGRQVSPVYFLTAQYHPGLLGRIRNGILV